MKEGNNSTLFCLTFTIFSCQTSNVKNLFLQMRYSKIDGPHLDTGLIGAWLSHRLWHRNTIGY